MNDKMNKKENFKSGFVAVVGRPNVGKSTLINKLIQEKISIISDKPQTTRNKIMCVLTKEDFQIVFLDTPGIHKPKHKLGEYMVKAADSALKEVNAVLFVVDATEEKGGGDEYVMKKIAQSGTPVILIVNKVDKITDKKKLLPIIKSYTDEMNFVAVIPLSALNDFDFTPLTNEIVKYLPVGPQYFPDDMITDQPERFVAAELIREKVMLLTREEIPHSVAVEIEQVKLRSNQDVYIRAVIYIERDSQKKIIIGAKGSLLKEIGQKARIDIEALLGNKVFLDLWVKVKSDWRNKGNMLKEFGYE